MICAITGSSGVLGSYIIKNNPKVKFLKFKGDISNEIEIKNWILKKKFDVFLHLAAIVSTTEIKKNYKLAKKVNYYANKNIVNTLLLKENVFFFYASSSHVYPSSLKKLRENTKPKPLTIYGRLKYSSEKYILKKFKNTKNNYCIGRIFSFTHHIQKKTFLIPSVYEKIKISRNNKEIDFKDTNHNRDFVSIKDINSCIFFLLKNKAGGIYNIASGKKINLQYLIKIICKKFNKIPKFLANKNSTTLIANISKIKKIGWRPKDDIVKILKDYELSKNFKY
jgi:nucleoside-diphosphate-sugar epimerase